MIALPIRCINQAGQVEPVIRRISPKRIAATATLRITMGKKMGKLWKVLLLNWFYRAKPDNYEKVATAKSVL